MMCNLVSAAVLLILATSVKCQEIPNRIRNITVTAGEDIFLDWSNQDPAQVLWTKEGIPVQALVAAQEQRIHVVKEKGLLILNSKWEDRGYYTGFVVTKEPARTSDQVFFVDVAPNADVDLSSGGEFSCGFPRVRGKVVGGSPVEHGQSPWTVMLYDSIKEEFICGGVLLNRRWVLTAATCFAYSRFNDTYKDELELRFGENDRYIDEGTEVTLHIEQIISHPNYDRQSYDSDIALLKLRQPVTYSDYILPICLPSELRAQRLVKEERSGFVTGWGQTSHFEFTSRILRKVPLTIVNQEACGQMHTQMITNNMFCAGAYDPSAMQDACRGDQGDPFAIKDDERWYLVGLVSWGIGCADPNFPGVYTRVNRFRQWIEDLIQDGKEMCHDGELSQQLTELIAQLKAKDEELKKAISETCSVPKTTEPAHTTSITTLTTTTTPPPTLPPVEKVQCRDGACWHVSGYRVYARCEDGYCVCDSPDYNRYSCLASVGRCEIHKRPNTAAANASYNGIEQKTYQCVTLEPGRKSIHVLSVYEGNRRTGPQRPPAADDINVIIETESPSNKPVVLFLVSYEPVRWIIDVPSVVVIQEVVMVSFYLDESSVEWLSGSPPNDDVHITGSRSFPRGWGSDSGGGNTAGLLKYIQDNYGPVNSFTGTVRADTWTLDISYGSWLQPSVSCPVCAEHLPPNWTNDYCEADFVYETMVRYDGQFRLLHSVSAADGEVAVSSRRYVKPEWDEMCSCDIITGGETLLVIGQSKNHRTDINNGTDVEVLHLDSNSYVVDTSRNRDSITRVQPTC